MTGFIAVAVSYWHRTERLQWPTSGPRPKLPLKIWQAPSAMESLSASSLDKADAQK